MYQQASNIKNLDLKKYCWIGTGGLASNVFIAESELHLSNYLKNKNKKNFFVLGSGSNILFRDKGFSGKLIKLSSKFRGINYSSDKKYLVCGAASLKKELSYFALKNNITGFEFLSCIPGNLAGGVIMNAGCFEHEFSQIIHEIIGYNFNGFKKVLPLVFIFSGCEFVFFFIKLSILCLTLS